MKQVVRAAALVLVLGAACLPARSINPPACRYLCGSTYYPSSLTPCCTHTFICPNGQPSQIVQEYKVVVGGYIYCP